MGSVVSLVEARLEPDPKVLAAAEELLALVKTGAVDGVGWTVSYTDNTTCHSHHAGMHGPTMFGALELLKARMMDRYMKA